MGVTATEDRVHRPSPRERTSAADAPPVVKVEDLSVRLSLQKEKVTTLRERAIRFVERRPVEMEEFWPLRNISFEIARGEVFGIVGRNGAGKSTLLKTIAGVVAPTLGNVEVQGRIAPLLELGAGFDHEMTGRENIFLYGSLLGFPRRKLVERFQHIVEFSELDEFIDVPLKNYSSGMTARLGFAVATDVDADILIVDEALTVGDSRFQLKCMERIENFRQRGMSILFVSHNTEQVRRLCARALWLDNGAMAMCGPVDEVMAAYSATEFEPTVAAIHRGPVEVESVEPGVAIEGPPAEADLAKYDFLDISLYDTHSVEHCALHFGGTGLGMSSSADVVEKYRANGVDAIRADAVAVDFPERSFRYVSIMDSLQYFMKPGEIEMVLANVTRWASDFAFIRIPSFEDTDYLKALGLKFFWTDWTGLPPHLRIDQLTQILQSLGLSQFNFMRRQPVLSSEAPVLLPVDAPPNQAYYDAALHGPKPVVQFQHPVYAQLDLYIALRAFDPGQWRSIISTSIDPQTGS